MHNVLTKMHNCFFRKVIFNKPWQSNL